VLVAVLAGALAVPAAYGWRAPTLQEFRLVVKGLPAYYHQSCIRYSIRVSTVDRSYAAVFFRFVRSRAPCRPFDGQVLMKRLTPTMWVKIGEGSSWPCRVRAVPTRVVRDLFGGCAP
jgi:hypothetical protein